MLGTLSRGLLLCAALSIAMLTAADAAAIVPLGLHREAVDESRYPWSSVGKLYNESGSSCSGVVISNDKILTAAHCLFNYRTGRFIAAEALHFLVGYRTGRYSAHVRVAHYEIGPGFDPLRYGATSDADWAVLTATERLPAAIEPLRLRRDPTPSGTKAVLVGYPQDRAFAMTADRDCELLGRVDDGRLVLHTCRGIKGYSGAPILVSTGSREVQIAGIQIASLRSGGAQEMIAVAARSILSRADEDSDPAAAQPIAQANDVCRVPDDGAMPKLADVWTKLAFHPQEPDGWIDDPFDMVSFAPEQRPRFPANALAWLALEPYMFAGQLLSWQ